ncbi:membrane protein [Annulohypoxylon nitens]|nr:membrane protein [Annulohypoxylon nitens]
MNKFLGNPERSRASDSQFFQYACIYSAIPLGICTLGGLLAPMFFPPLSPSLTAEETVQYYRDHEKGIQAGAVLLQWASVFYLAFTIAISNQLQRIPNLHYTVKALQVVAGGLSSLCFLFIGIVLALASYRLKRNVEITQALNDLFWFLTVMASPPFIAQYFAFGYAILTDNSTRPQFPKLAGVLNMIVCVLFIPQSVSVHLVKTGPVAWDGVVSFWIPLVLWDLSLALDFICLIRAMSLSIKTHVSEEVVID